MARFYMFRMEDRCISLTDNERELFINYRDLVRELGEKGFVVFTKSSFCQGFPMGVMIESPHEKNQSKYFFQIADSTGLRFIPVDLLRGGINFQDRAKYKRT